MKKTQSQLKKLSSSVCMLLFVLTAASCEIEPDLLAKNPEYNWTNNDENHYYSSYNLTINSKSYTSGSGAEGLTLLELQERAREYYDTHTDKDGYFLSEYKLSLYDDYNLVYYQALSESDRCLAEYDQELNKVNIFTENICSDHTSEIQVTITLESLTTSDINSEVTLDQSTAPGMVIEVRKGNEVFSSASNGSQCKIRLTHVPSTGELTRVIIEEGLLFHKNNSLESIPLSGTMEAYRKEAAVIED